MCDNQGHLLVEIKNAKCTTGIYFKWLIFTIEMYYHISFIQVFWCEHSLSLFMSKNKCNSSYYTITLVVQIFISSYFYINSLHCKLINTISTTL